MLIYILKILFKEKEMKIKESDNYEFLSEDSVRVEGLMCMFRSAGLWKRGIITDEEFLGLARDIFCG